MSVRGPRALQMQWVAERLQRRFLNCFAACRMRVNRAGDILEADAHFDRKRKCCRQFGNATADRVKAEDQIGVGTRHHPHEAILGLCGHGAAIGGERKLAKPDLATLRAGLFR